MVNENEKEDLNKIGTLAGIGVGITSVICPPLGGTIATVYGAAGLGAKAISAFSDDPETKDIAEATSKFLFTVASGGLAGFGKCLHGNCNCK